jgi:hypothetical protein
LPERVLVAADRDAFKSTGERRVSGGSAGTPVTASVTHARALIDKFYRGKDVGAEPSASGQNNIPRKRRRIGWESTRPRMIQTIILLEEGRMNSMEVLTSQLLRHLLRNDQTLS